MDVDLHIRRRNPRQEWIARNRLHPLHGTLRVTEHVVTGPTGLVRKNPHHSGFMGPNGIKRIDRSGASEDASGLRVTSSPPPQTLPLVVVENPHFYIAVVLDLVGGRLTAHDKDCLGQAHQLVAGIDGKGAVVAIVFGESKEKSFDTAGVDRLIHFDGARYDGYCRELQIASLIEINTSLMPRHWLFPDSVHGGADLGTRLAVKLGDRLASNAWQVGVDTTVCRGGSEFIDITRDTPRVLLLAQECAEPVDETRHEVKSINLYECNEQSMPAIWIEDKGAVAVDPSKISLAEAEFILSAGNGVRDWEQFHQAAQCLGATQGASRVVVDDGFMPRETQVGATGTWVSARVYLAVGISGAIQHLQGIAQCDKVIAINLDAGCDMVSRADLSVIGDSQKVLKELINLVQRYRQKGQANAA